MHIELKSTITCPECGFSHEETMPTDACTWYWECPSCGELLRPGPGDCCVFCSYGTVPCPPVQQSGDRDCCR
ncbi:MAG: GDCCVxC domain-containing (seleno)protein [Pseudomonadota bacterium]|nr:GDCCVxC domain-containing (seleno)protein [Pseudomonadota bacterium]